MSYMFSECAELISFKNISKLYRNNANDIKYMFYGCKSLLSFPDFSKWNKIEINEMNKIISNKKELSFLYDKNIIKNKMFFIFVC